MIILEIEKNPQLSEKHISHATKQISPKEDGMLNSQNSTADQNNCSSYA